MKIKINKIANSELQILRYLSDDILEFKLDTKTIFEEKLRLLKENPDENSGRDMEQLQQAFAKMKSPASITLETWINTNLTHVFNADSYFTNGQQIYSIVKANDRYEIGKHKDIWHFQDYFYSTVPITRFSLEHFDLPSYITRKKAETEIVRALSTLDIIRIPILHDSELDYIEARFVYPGTYTFRLWGKEISRVEEYGKSDLDTITVEIIKMIRPKVLKCCRNCTNFQFSGMSHDFSAGTVGYCMLMRNQLTEKSVNESTTHIWNWCDDFSRNERI